MSLIPPMPPGNELKTLLQDVPQLNRKLEENPGLLNGTRLKEQDLSGLVVKNATLKNLNWLEIKLTGAVFEDVTIEDSKWVGVRCEECTLRNVTFQETTLDQREGHREGQTSFNKSRLDNVRFIKSHLLDVDIMDFQPSTIYFEGSTLKNREDAEIFSPSGTIMEGELKAYITNSTFDNGSIINLVYPSEVIIENSRLENASLGGHLKRLEITHSHFEGAGPGYADYVSIADSKVHMGLPEARFIHLKNNEYLEEGSGPKATAINSSADTFLIEGCKNSARLVFYKSRIANLIVTKCKLEDPVFAQTQIGRLQLCDVQITRDTEHPYKGRLQSISWDKASIRQAQFHNVTFSGPFPVKNLRIGHLQSADSQLPDELTRAAKQQSPLDGGCPPLPDLEALKQDALSDDPPPPLSQRLQELSPFTRPPFWDLDISATGILLLFREAWIDDYHTANHGLGARAQPPVLTGATLHLTEAGKDFPLIEMCFTPGEWRSGVTYRNEACRALPLHTVDPKDDFRLPLRSGQYPTASLTLDLHLAPVTAPARFDVTSPWRLTLQVSDTYQRNYNGSLFTVEEKRLQDQKTLQVPVVWG